jgi:hypothetical protein
LKCKEALWVIEGVEQGGEGYKVKPRRTVSSRGMATATKAKKRGGGNEFHTTTDIARKLGIGLASTGHIDQCMPWLVYQTYRSLREVDFVTVLRVSLGAQSLVNRYAAFYGKLCNKHCLSGDNFMLLPNDYTFTVKQEEYIKMLNGSVQRCKIEDLPMLKLV